jgi:hypothetical protein
MTVKHIAKYLFYTSLFTTSLTACFEQKPSVSPQLMADAIHTVIESDRTAYTKYIINRLVIEEQVIKATEHWKDEKTLLLPAQMFRAGAEIAAEKQDGFSYALLSQWALNKKNAAKTEIEKQGLITISETGKAFYSEEILGETTYFTAIYPDIAVAEACVTCHNEHEDTPKKDFKIGDVMGGVIIRIPLS